MKTHLRIVGMISALSLACVGTLYAQKAPASKTAAHQDKVLDGLAKTPFLTQRQADRIKGVRDGGAAHKAEESVLDSPEGGGSLANAKLPSPLAAPAQNGQPGQAAQGQQPPPKPEPKPITWRLKGMAGSGSRAVAVFDTGGPSLVMVRAGESIDGTSKVVKVGRQVVVIEHEGRHLNFWPW